MNVRGVFQTQILSLLSLAFSLQVVRNLTVYDSFSNRNNFQKVQRPHRVSVKVQPTGTTLEQMDAPFRLMRPPSYEVYVPGIIASS